MEHRCTDCRRILPSSPSPTPLLCTQCSAAAPPPSPGEVGPYAGGRPVPPLPGQRLVEPSLAAPALTADSETKEAVRG